MQFLIKSVIEVHHMVIFMRLTSTEEDKTQEVVPCFHYITWFNYDSI